MAADVATYCVSGQPYNYGRATVLEHGGGDTASKSGRYITYTDLDVTFYNKLNTRFDEKTYYSTSGAGT